MLKFSKEEKTRGGNTNCDHLYHIRFSRIFCALLSFCQPFRKEAVADKEAFWGLADQLLVH